MVLELPALALPGCDVQVAPMQVAVDRVVRDATPEQGERLDRHVPHSARGFESHQSTIACWLVPKPKIAWPPLRPEAPQPILRASSSTTR